MRKQNGTQTISNFNSTNFKYCMVDLHFESYMRQAWRLHESLFRAIKACGEKNRLLLLKYISIELHVSCLVHIRVQRVLKKVCNFCAFLKVNYIFMNINFVLFKVILTRYYKFVLTDFQSLIHFKNYCLLCSALPRMPFFLANQS